MDIDTLLNTLIQKFQLTSFNLGQREIIESVLSGKDVLAIMPTGGGKSLCYQLPAIMKPGLTVVISPLVALMNDQVAALKSLGLPAGCIHSGIHLEHRKKIFREMSHCESYILYLSPERIQKPGFSPWLKKQRVSLFAIDEAHCVSQWGHDFRIEYSQLKILREIQPYVPMIGLTATATPLVKRDIIEQLGLKKPDQHVYGFYRSNLYYQVEFCSDENDKVDFVLSALAQVPSGRIIIYCGTRKKAESWSELLVSRGESVAFYHAGMSTQERTLMEKKYKNGQVRVLAATNAFGMGIDHPDVRLVIHTQMPGNIESYYQEIGRAGRDGQPATCLLAYSRKDKGLQSFFITQSDASKRIKNLRWNALNAMVQYAEGSECRHSDILTYFKDQKRISRCGHCDSCAPRSELKIIRKKQVSLSLPVKTRRKKADVTFRDVVLTDEQKCQIELIRDWRREYAKEHDIPAFMVFSDKTLLDLILKNPKCESDLESVYGLGQKKIEVFGQKLMNNLKVVSNSFK